MLLAMLRDARRRPAGDGGLLSMGAELFGSSHFLDRSLSRLGEGKRLEGLMVSNH